jgi:23S rRNA (guanosine2251-2'-O)-methyltransferase
MARRGRSSSKQGDGRQQRPDREGSRGGTGRDRPGGRQQRPDREGSSGGTGRDRPGGRQQRPGDASRGGTRRDRPDRPARPGRGEAAPARERERERAPESPRERGRDIVYGRNAVREALRGRRRVHRIWATEAAAREGWSGAPVKIVPAAEIEALAGSDAHQGVVAEVDPYPYADAAELLTAPDPLIVALDEVTDPQNLGAICRTAECAGATGVILPERRSAEVTAAVCKASAGAVEHLPVARVRNLADFLADAKSAGCWCYGAAAGAPTRYDQPEYNGGVVMVLGAEGRGLRPRVAAACDDLVSLPLRGHIESLNVSATAAVLLYEILQQRLDTST